jgi:hypothetical protein
MKKYLILTIALLLGIASSVSAQQRDSKKEALKIVKELGVPIDRRNSYYFISELDCNTCVEKLLNENISKQNKNNIYLIYYTPSKKRIAFGSTMFSDFILKSHFYLCKKPDLYNELNKILPIGRGPYLFNISNESITAFKSFSIE